LKRDITTITAESRNRLIRSSEIFYIAFAQ
jgi:hypothetical protein